MRLLPLFLAIPLATETPNPVQERADRFLQLVNPSYQALTTVQQQAAWLAFTDVKPEHDAASEWAAKALAAFNGSPALIRETRNLLAERDRLRPVTVRQLEKVLFSAAEGPMTNPALTAERIAAETRQQSILNSYVYKLDGMPITANGIEKLLDTSRDLGERQRVWAASKEVGPPLKGGLLRLRDLRNGCARELGYPDYFALQAARHGMTTAEMLELNRKFLDVLRPLYVEIHTWAKYELARKYGQPVPKAIPAHWINNRWSQEWGGLVEGADFDPYLKSWTPERIVRTGAAFFEGLGLQPFPPSFWERSDLYPVEPGAGRKKNAHAWCWHVDLDQDVRSLMNVEADFRWFGTVHHELGHGTYDLAYSTPDVPYLLRDAASPAFHEGVAELISLASRQVPYLKSVGVLRADFTIDEKRLLLAEALDTGAPHMAWASGTMTEWEAEFYQGMPADKLNQRWWDLVREKQGVVPPMPRGEEYCDAASKSHITDAPAYYYNYAIAQVLKHQLHDYICKRILRVDPRSANYAGNKEVGAWLRSWLARGATEDWRKVLKDATGEDLSIRAMAEYYAPLVDWLRKENAGRQKGW